MIYKSGDYIDLINEEIKWCEENRDKGIYYPDDVEKNKIYQDAFIKGLEQAKLLIRQTLILR